MVTAGLGFFVLVVTIVTGSWHGVWLRRNGRFWTENGEISQFLGVNLTWIAFLGYCSQY